MEELESGEVEYELVEEFLTSLKKEFGRGEEESVKVAELRRMEQGEKTMEEFVQEFKSSTILRAKLSFEIYREKNIAIFLTGYISSQ